MTPADIRPYAARVAAGAAAIAGLWCLLAVLTRDQPAQTRFALVDLAHGLSAAFLLAAGALRAAAWRITGRARAAWSAIAMTVAGLTIPLVSLTDHLPQAGISGGDPSALPRDLVHLALISVGAVALLTPDVVSRLRPLHVTAPLVLGCLAIAAVLTVCGPSPLPSPLMAETIAVTQWVVTAAWVLLAAAYVVLGLRRHRNSDVAVGAGLVAIAVGGACRALIGPTHYRAMALPPAMMLFVTVGLAGLAAATLWQLQTGRDTRLLRVIGERDGARADLRDAERDQAGRLHDARSAILAVSGAARLLAHPEPGARVDPERLRQLVSAELHRLGALLDPAFRSSNRRFRPSDVVEPLVLAHRLGGARITSSMGADWAMGSPEATATAVANLLSNARAHAPGARIWVDVVATDVLTISVTDDGPGIAERERPLVLQAGVRGADAIGVGSGFGLANAAQCMAAQGGSLSIGSRPGGGTPVRLTLPVAPARAGDPSETDTAAGGLAAARRSTAVVPRQPGPRDLRMSPR